MQPATVLGQLVPPGEGSGNQLIPGLGWGLGHLNSGCINAARTVLADAVGAADAPGLAHELVQDFALDVLAFQPGDWWLRRGAVLRWVRGWCAEHGVQALPAAVAQLPPVAPNDYTR